MSWKAYTGLSGIRCRVTPVEILY